MEHYDVVTKRPRRSGAASLLPLIHLTPYSRFRQIADCGYLAPQPCSVLGENILYCSYADTVFRPSGKQRVWSADSPVALVLSPTILNRKYRFLPLDTGAIRSGRVPWFPNEKRDNLVTLFGVKDKSGVRLGRWLNRFFGGNSNYLSRKVRPQQHQTDEEILIADLCSGVRDDGLPDHTRDDMRVISQVECHFFDALILDNFLLHVFVHADELTNTEMLLGGRALVTPYFDQPICGNLPLDLVKKVRAMTHRD